ncbi:MAG: hypothetical protein ABFS35_15285 [Bacteroidota bacterium]
MKNHQSARNSYPIPLQNQFRDEVIRAVWSYVENYWTLKEETSEYFLLTRTNVTIKGHLIIALLFGWWLLFIPNLLYYLAMKEKKKVYK